MRQAFLSVLVGGCVGLLAGCSRLDSPPEATAAAGERAIETRGADSKPAAATPEADWPCWRGPAVNGRSADTNAPTRWSAAENIIWQTDVPGRGHSSPTLCGRHILLATADDETEVQSLLAFDRETGQPLWTTVIHTNGFVHKHEKNSHASATPACDGRRAYITFLNRDAIWVTAVDLDGSIVWQKEAGGFKTMHGYAASPALYGSLVIVASDSDGKSFLAALRSDTGEIAWKVDRPGQTSFASPIVAPVAGRDQVLLSGCEITAGYDPATGDELWRCQGPTMVIASTMTYAGDHVFTSGGFPGVGTMCIRADGTGDVTETHLVWRKARRFYVPSLLVCDDLLYGVTDDGVAHCFDATTGEQLWQQRMGPGVAFTSSPILAGDCIYACDEAGKTHVIKAGPKLERVAENDLGEGIFASPTICGGRIYLRTNKRLYCIGE
ncbi:MAG: outer membrane protein assembly factor BamB family protein [Planctomycetaceae bacterium]